MLVIGLCARNPACAGMPCLTAAPNPPLRWNFYHPIERTRHRASYLNHFVSGSCMTPPHLRPNTMQLFLGCPSPSNYYDTWLLVQLIFHRTTSYNKDHTTVDDSQWDRRDRDHTRSWNRVLPLGTKHNHFHGRLKTIPSVPPEPCRLKLAKKQFSADTTPLYRHSRQRRAITPLHNSLQSTVVHLLSNLPA